MRIDLLARRWGSPDGATDGMAMAVAFFAQTLAEAGHEIRAHRAESGPGPIAHPRIKWVSRVPLDVPIDWAADLVISVIAPVWRRTLAIATREGARDRLAFWHHHGDVPAGGGALLLHPPAAIVPDGWARAVVLPPSSWAADAGGTCTGSEILVPGASRMKGGHIAADVARMRPLLRFLVLTGRALPPEIATWKPLRNAEVSQGRLKPADFLGRARAVLLPTRAEVHPLVVVEAVARGIPVVVSDLPGCQAAGGDGAIYVRQHGTPSEWAAALDEALETTPVVVRQPPYATLAARALASLLDASAPVAVPQVRPALAPALRRPAPHVASSRPHVVICADVRTWAWHRKSVQLQLHLGDRFETPIVYLHEPGGVTLPTGADLYHTFEVFQCARLMPQLSPEAAMVTGITAHVWPTWERKHGEGTVRGWAARACALHANSVLLRDELAAHLGRPVHYCPNGVDETFFMRLRPRAKRSGLVVGWVGKPNARKGGDIVKEACARAGVELRTVERTHRDAHTPREMREFYQDLDVLCVASDMDGTPNPALEAAACGVAIVSNRIGNMPELLAGGEAGILVGPQSGPIRKPTVDELAEALRSLSPETAARMGEAARAEIERAWTWSRMAANYGAMWASAIGARARRAA